MERQPLAAPSPFFFYRQNMYKYIRTGPKGTVPPDALGGTGKHRDQMSISRAVIV